jgi:hypothetical protein
MHQERDDTRKPLFYLFSRFFFGIPNFYSHTSHIFMRAKVAFLCGKSPVESGKPHLQNAAFPPFRCNCFITFYICFFTSCTSGTVTLAHIVNAALPLL